MYRRTKIVGTLGPRSALPPTLGPLIQAGLDVARLNCSHASGADLHHQVENVRRVSKAAGKHVAILQDLSGPKVRSGTLEAGTMQLVAGGGLRVVPGTAAGREDWISCNHPGLAEDVRAGDRILLDDGLMELRVEKVDRERVIHTQIITGGVLKERKGMNLPDNTVSIPALTDKDKADLAIGMELGVDYVALSFVQSAEDIRGLKTEMARHGATVPIIAKIEKPQAVDNIDEILIEADGIMVARGDLAVEIGNHRVPMVQKQLLLKSNNNGNIDIVATQMLESMTGNPRPTRAEASDVANAILDGCDAVMLSGETAMGDYPIEAVKMMDAIAREVEPALAHTANLRRTRIPDDERAISVQVARAAAELSRDLPVKGIVVFTLSGRTARVVRGFVPGVPIFAITQTAAACRTMALYNGVVPLQMAFPGNSDAMIAQGEQLLAERGLMEEGDLAIVVAGFMKLRGVANMMKVVKI